MYSGLLPKGLTEEDLSPDDEDENTGSPAEKQSTSTGSESATSSLSGGSQDVWQKFHELQKKKNEMKTMKNPRRRRRRRRREEKKGADSEEAAESRACREEQEEQEEQEKPWDGLKQYFGANDRFHPPACSKPPPKSGLEKSIEEAIAEGDIAKAEEMSDRLATRELAVKIAQAADCRDFVQRRQEEEALRAAQKRKRQISWGFEAKKRWETKSNMGFM